MLRATGGVALSCIKVSDFVVFLLLFCVSAGDERKVLTVRCSSGRYYLATFLGWVLHHERYGEVVEGGRKLE
jgi:hypothetical protein